MKQTNEHIIHWEPKDIIHIADADAVDFVCKACNNFYKMKVMLESHLPWLIELHGTDSIVGIKQLEQLLKTLDK